MFSLANVSLQPTSNLECFQRVSAPLVPISHPRRYSLVLVSCDKDPSLSQGSQGGIGIVVDKNCLQFVDNAHNNSVCPLATRKGTVLSEKACRCGRPSTLVVLPYYPCIDMLLLGQCGRRDVANIVPLQTSSLARSLVERAWPWWEPIIVILIARIPTINSCSAREQPSCELIDQIILICVVLFGLGTAVRRFYAFYCYYVCPLPVLGSSLLFSPRQSIIAFCSPFLTLLLTAGNDKDLLDLESTSPQD